MLKEKEYFNFNKLKTKANTSENSEEGTIDDENSLLSGKQTNELQSLVNNFFDDCLKISKQESNFYQKSYELTSRINSYLLNTDKNFIPNEEYSGRVREANKITITELLKFCEENQGDPNFNQFLKSVRAAFFNSSPSLSSNLNIEDKFSLTAKATRSVEIYGQIGGCMADDLVYSLSWEYEPQNFDKFLEVFKNKPYAEQFDEIHLIKLLSADAAGTGSSEEGLSNLRIILENMKKGTSSAFLRYAISLSEKQLDEEEANPSRGIVKYSEDKGNLRFNEYLPATEKNESMNLEKIVYPNIPVEPGNKLIKIAADAMAIIDHSNTPVSYGLFSTDEYNQKKEQASKVSLIDLKNIKDIFLQPEEINLENLITSVNNKIFSPYYEIEGSEKNKIAEIWSKFSPEVPLDSWLNFLNFQEKIIYLKNELQIDESEINAEVEDKNLKASNVFLQYFSTVAPQILEIKQNAGFNSIWKEFDSAYKKNNTEEAYSEAIDFISCLNSSQLFNQSSNTEEQPTKKKDFESQLKLFYNNLKKEHENNFLEAERLISDMYTKADSLHRGLIEDYYSELSLIGSNFEEISKELLIKLQVLEKNLKNNALEITFNDYNSLHKDNQISDYINNKEAEEISLLLRHMQRPDMEAYINDKLNINLKDTPFRYQIYLLKFLSENSEEKVKEIAEFINAASTDKDKINRIKSFLCLSVDYGTGEAILNLGKKLRPEQTDQLLSKVAEISDSDDAQSVSRIYQELFFNKNVDTNKLTRVSLSRASNLLVEANSQLSSETEGLVNINKLIVELDRDLTRFQENLEECAATAKKLNEIYRDFGDSAIEDLASINGQKSDVISDEKFEDLVKGFNESKKELIMNDFNEHKKFSAERLKEIIRYYQEQVEIESYSWAMPQVNQDFEDEKTKNGEDSVKDFDWIARLENYNKEFPSTKTEEQIIYEQTIKKLQQALPLQIALEKKIDQLVYGQEETKLPDGFSNFENSSVTPENIPEKTPLYFPVGISKDLPSWEQVLKGEKKFAKPIDIYGYMFWLNNQEHPVRLIVCDEIQVNNYVVRYGKSENEARETARAIGAREAAQYKNIIDTFGLTNIMLENYDEFLKENEKDYKRYEGEVKKLAELPNFKEAFLAMVQESVSGADKEEYIAYALEELSWILAADGTKIGHLNEARYDVLAEVIRNWERAGKERGIDVLTNPSSPEAQTLLNTVHKIIRDTLNEKKSKLDKNSSAGAYFQRLQDHLGKIKTDSKVGLDKSIKKESLSLNFICPEVGSASFGFRGDFEEKESVIKFKEPYSTYFYKTESDLLINSDQVVAAGEGLIGGKILTLDNKKQLKYAESVVRPILKHYFASLEKAPAEYFEKINKSREELLNEAKESTSLLSVLRFIQKYIVRPTELV